MKKYFLSVCVLSISLFFNSFHTLNVYAHPHPQLDEKHKHLHMSDQEINDLIKKGYTRHEVFRAYFISKHSNEKNVEKILKVYREKQSWKETAKQFGVDLEKVKKEHLKKHKEFYEKNKAQIINYLATYTGKSTASIEQYLKEDVDLHFLIFAAAISKKGNMDISKIIQDKKSGKSIKEITESAKLDPKSVFHEVKNIQHGIFEAIKNKK
ncbi:hypothetical protein [Heyndrickxia oleronia]|uniref:Uncharacterized protein n=1 Tax=Heyndrickxia oleronia TaxID=38875 RepID=A0AAW6SWT7_9BACI|nr:hypothetical protein [Heyndrickxia oleronia]MDH5162568.1 hypothetical protein [Heyndrickxia oleronia]